MTEILYNYSDFLQEEQSIIRKTIQQLSSSKYGYCTMVEGCLETIIMQNDIECSENRKEKMVDFVIEFFKSQTI